MANSKKKAAVTKSAGKLAKNPKMAANKSKSKSTRAAAPVWTTVGTAGEEIADEAYKRKKSLVQVEVAEGVTEIGSGAFSGCVNLESVKIPKSVTRIEEGAVMGNYSVGCPSVTFDCDVMRPEGRVCVSGCARIPLHARWW